jgi:hypothetical protein
MKSGNLNFREPSGPLRGCNGTALPLTVMMHGGKLKLISAVSSENVFHGCSEVGLSPVLFVIEVILIN